MRTKTMLLVVAIATIGLTMPAAQAVEKAYMWPTRRSELTTWHGVYAHPQYGAPVALVVPPTSNLQTNWGWGPTASRVSRVDHQFGRNYVGPGPYGGPFRGRPAWPQDTMQFGVYSVRGPW